MSVRPKKAGTRSYCWIPSTSSGPKSLVTKRRRGGKERRNQSWTHVRVAIMTSRVLASPKRHSSIKTQHSGKLYLLEACGELGAEGSSPLLQHACSIGAVMPACPQT